MSFPSRRGLTLLGIMSLVPLLNFPLALISNRTLFARDISMVWAPQVEAVVRQIGGGEMPFFDSRRAFGQPLFADPRAEVLYPPAWIHWILPTAISYPLFCALHLVIAGLGAARLARRLLRGTLPLSAEVAAGLVYAAGGPLLSLVSHWHHLAAAAWMPWILERAEAASASRTPWFSLSALTALQIFAGSPDYSFLTFVLCFLRLMTRGHQAWAEKRQVILALLLGVLMGAVQLLPSLAFARAASRDVYPIGWASSPLHPALTLETALPVRVETWPLRPEMRGALLYGSQVWLFSHYLGLSAWALALLGLARAEPSTRRFAAGGVLIGVGFAWGIRNEWLQTALAAVPLVSGLRFPTKHLAGASLGLAVLAAGGVTHAASWTATEKRRILVGAGLGLAGCILLFLEVTDRSAPFEWSALISPGLALVALTGILQRGVGSAAWLLPALVAVDLLGGNRFVNPTTPADFFRDRPPLSSVIPSGSRLYTSDYSIQLRGATVRPPDGSPYALARVPKDFGRDEALALAATWYLNPPSAGRFGYFGSFDLDILDFYRAPLKTAIADFVTSRDPAFVVDRLRRGSVDFVVTMDPPGLWSSLPLVKEERLFFEAPVRVYRVPDPWPRVRMEDGKGSLLIPLPRVLEMRDGRVRAEVDAPEGARLVVATAFDQGFFARVDGVESVVAENDLAFVSVPLVAGHHSVELSYRPPGLELGAIISAVSLLAALGLGSGSWRAGRGTA